MKDYYAPIVRDWIFPISRKFQKCNYSEKMAEARANLHLDREQLRNMQIKKLRALIQHAGRNVPYYRDQFNQLGIKPDDIRTWNDYQALPILTRAEVREHNDRFLSQKPRSPLIKWGTSGSTGEPLRIYTSQIAIAAEYASRYRALEHWGIEVGDRVIMFYGAERYTHGTGWKKAVNLHVIHPLKFLVNNRRRLPVENISEENFEDQWRFIQKFRPKYFHGYPSAFFLLARYVKDRSYSGGSSGVKLIYVGGEILYDWQKEFIAGVFECPIAEVYGAYEIGEAAHSYPCGALHINEDFVIVEVIKSHPENEFGQIVCTRLDNWEFPLIRYNIEDLAPPIHEHAGCELGLGFAMFDRIVGRTFDQIQLSNGRIIHGTYFTTLMKLVDGLVQYQVNQREPDRFEILVVINPEVYGEQQELFIKDRMKTLLGPIDVTITHVESIPTEGSGKFNYIRSDCKI
ncbi:MAG: phenylacetate--CoA ligase family protein [Anaerolineales bacterium]|jgi:phenylacetate-CoA ligase